jgi:hypothetical protein
MVGASSGINVGALMNPVLSAQGGQALMAAGLLGMTGDQFVKMQNSRGGTSQIIGRIAGIVKKIDHGPNGTLGTEAVLQGTGLLDLSQLRVPFKTDHR